MRLDRKVDFEMFYAEPGRKTIYRAVLSSRGELLPSIAGDQFNNIDESKE